MITPDQIKASANNVEDRKASIMSFIDNAIVATYNSSENASNSIIRIPLENIFPQFTSELYKVLESYSQHWKYYVAREKASGKVFLYICETQIDLIDKLISTNDKQFIDTGQRDYTPLFTNVKFVVLYNDYQTNIPQEIVETKYKPTLVENEDEKAND